MEIGVLEEDFSSEWPSLFQTFVIAKKIGAATIRIVTDFRKLNLLLKCQAFPIPMIGYMICSMEGFTIASELDVNMVYYHIKLDHIVDA
jgi:hypothetical protein